MPAIVSGMMNWRSLLTGIATGDQAMFVTRKAFEAVGGFPDIPLMEDVAMSKRLKRIGRPLCLAARVTTSGRRFDRRGALRTIVSDVAAAACLFARRRTARSRAAMATSRAMAEPVAIAIMAKAPAPGLAKTRLIPALGAAGAAALSAADRAHGRDRARSGGRPGDDVVRPGREPSYVSALELRNRFGVR
jgi:hypothetical protein